MQATSPKPPATASPGSAETGFARLQTFTSFRYREYRLHWFGTLFSSAGQWIQQVTLGWLTYQITGSAFLLGAVNGIRSLPLLLLGPFGGVAADRFDRKQLLFLTQIFLVVTAAIFATVVLTGNAAVWNIILFSLLTGVGWAFNMPLRQSIMPNLVPKSDLMNAVALNSAGMNTTRIMGPSVAGFLIAVVGVSGNFYIQALAYLGIAITVWNMDVPPNLSRATARSISVMRNLREGLRFVWHHPTLRYQMLLALVPVLLAMPYTSLMPIFAQDVLGVGPEGLGLLMATPGIGALVGTLTLATVGARVEHKGRIMFPSIVALGVSLLLFSLSRSFVLSLVLQMFVGGAQMTWMTTNQTMLQISTPDEYRGRVMGIYMLDQGLMPLGSFAAGGVAGIWGAPFAVGAMAVILLTLITVAYVSIPSMRRI